MRRLIDLFEEKKRLPITEQAHYIRSRLPEVVTDQHLKFRKLGDPVVPVSRRVLIGIATWSHYDLELVDAIAESKQESHPGNEAIEIFDVDEPFDKPAAPRYDFENYVPGIGKVFGTPVLGIWEGEELVTRAWGAKAREFLIKRYDLDLPPLGRQPN